jgi:hypothetical protein
MVDLTQWYMDTPLLKKTYGQGDTLVRQLGKLILVGNLFFSTVCFAQENTIIANSVIECACLGWSQRSHRCGQLWATDWPQNHSFPTNLHA